MQGPIIIDDSSTLNPDEIRARITALVEATLMNYTKQITFKVDHILALNISDQAFTAIKTIYPQAQIDRINFSQLENSNFPVGQKTIDLLIANLTFTSPIDETALFLDVKRILSAKGVFLFANYDSLSVKTLIKYSIKPKELNLIDDKTSAQNLDNLHYFYFKVIDEHILILKQPPDLQNHSLPEKVDCDIFIASLAEIPELTKSLRDFPMAIEGGEKASERLKEHAQENEEKEPKEQAEEEMSEDERETEEEKKEPEEVEEVDNKEEKAEKEEKENEVEAEENEGDEVLETEKIESNEEGEVEKKDEPETEAREKEAEPNEVAEEKVESGEKELEKRESADEKKDEREEKNEGAEKAETKEDQEKVELKETEEKETEEEENNEEEEKEESEEEKEEIEENEDEEKRRMELKEYLKKLDENQEELKAHSEKLAQHKEESEELIKELNETKEAQEQREKRNQLLEKRHEEHEKMLLMYKTMQKNQKKTMSNFLDAHEKTLEHRKYKEVLQQHHELIEDRDKQIDEHDEFLNKMRFKP